MRLKIFAKESGDRSLYESASLDFLMSCSCREYLMREFLNARKPVAMLYFPAFRNFRHEMLIHFL